MNVVRHASLQALKEGRRPIAGEQSSRRFAGRTPRRARWHESERKTRAVNALNSSGMPFGRVILPKRCRFEGESILRRQT